MQRPREKSRVRRDKDAADLVRRAKLLVHESFLEAQQVSVPIWALFAEAIAGRDVVAGRVGQWSRFELIERSRAGATSTAECTIRRCFVDPLDGKREREMVH